MEYGRSGIYRSGRLQMFFKINVLKNFRILTEKHLRGVSFDKVAGLKAYYYIKKRLRHCDTFPINIVKLLRTAFFIEHLWWLLLDFLQNLLKATVKKIISRQFFSEISEKLFLVFAASFLKITPSQVFFAVLVFL